MKHTVAAKTLGAAAVALVMLNFLYHHYNDLIGHDPTAPADSPYPRTEAATSPQEDEERKCEPKRNLVYLKTHKCASSTLQRVFLRYGKEHNLSFVLPASSNYLGWKLPFRPRMIPPDLRSPSGKYNMFLLHTRFSEDAISQVMPRDCVYVTILREPIDQFESLWGFQELEQFYNMSIDQFAKLPYEKAVRWRKGDLFGIHQMMFDLGHGAVGEDTEAEFQHRLDQINSTFDLVMLAERFDESLVLLKHLMCWTTDDIVYLSINARKENKKKNITDETKSLLHSLNKPDVKLYDFFAKIFDRKVKAFGEEKMQKELQEMRDVNDKMKKRCVADEESKVTGELKWREDIVSLAVKEDKVCVDLVKKEVSFVDEVRERQRMWIKNGWPLNKTVT
ncbi:galactosylceramide sulfotransferase-like [Penaeus indicus]|uniref:galactosylceramide sulfotransferase-like n=1 Tax=Penaeus indicus TaxID=29960 RepID=UPI00300C9ED6